MRSLPKAVFLAAIKGNFAYIALLCSDTEVSFIFYSCKLNLILLLSEMCALYLKAVFLAAIKENFIYIAPLCSDAKVRINLITAES